MCKLEPHRRSCIEPQRTPAPDLLNDIPKLVDRIPIKAANTKAKWAIAISRALNDCAMSREEVARQMSEYLGEKISPNILAAYASQGRDTHIINLPRLEALIYVTKDAGLVDLLAEVIDHRVVHEIYAPYLEYAYKKAAWKKLGAELKAYEEAFDE